MDGGVGVTDLAGEVRKTELVLVLVACERLRHACGVARERSPVFCVPSAGQSVWSM
jgi:hypothetical protein